MTNICNSVRFWIYTAVMFKLFHFDIAFCKLPTIVRNAWCLE